MSTPKKPISSNKSNLRMADPYAKREAALYDNPLPSREFILQVMTEQGVPLVVEQLYSLLAIKKKEHEIFSRRLNAMVREGQIIRNRKGALCIAEKLNLISGTVQGHADGFGFLLPDDRERYSADLFLSPHEMSKVLHGDRVMVRPSGVDRRGRPEGKIVEVLERKNTTLVGRIIRGDGFSIVAAEDKRVNQDILIPYHLDMQARDGQVVMVELTEQPSGYAKPMGKVIEILGNYADAGMEIEIALRKHHLPYEFSPETLEQTKKYPATVRAGDRKGRVDLRELPLITIDSETARDFDDAVYCEQQGRGWRLVVAIADVSFYVKPGDAVDQDAYERGNSVYFPRRVIPMLPEALSNGLCSLNPDVDRLCLVCDMQIDAFGIVKRYQFYPAVMRSKARMTYTEIYDMLMHPTGETAQNHAWLMPHVEHLYTLYQLLLKAHEKRGSIEFASAETVMFFDDSGKIEHIEAVERNEAHRIIEECMLAANVCAANFLAGHEHPALYRVHEGPTVEKLEALRTFMGEFGFGVGGGDSPHAKDYGKLLAQFKGRPDEQLLQTVLLRSMQQAVYSPENIGHFGLAYDSYMHFTSPIRRYPDLLTHRAIKAALQGVRYQAGDWQALGVHCSMTERRADDATRDVEAWLKCYYMQDKIGEVFAGTVAGVTSFGLFVALDGVYVEGLLHVAELGNDYFNYDKARHEMVGERTGVRYRLGDRLRVKVSRVDLESSKIDFLLVVSGGNAKRVDKVSPETGVEKASKTARGKKTAKGAHQAAAVGAGAQALPDSARIRQKAAARRTTSTTAKKPAEKTPTAALLTATPASGKTKRKVATAKATSRKKSSR